MTEPKIPPSLTVIDALIALASRDGLGEEVLWEEVEISIVELLDTAVSESNLRRRMDKLNDPEVAMTLTDWLERAADARDKDAHDAARPSEKLLAPLQGVGLGGAATGVILTATGALTLGVGTLIAIAALTAAGSASMGRVKLSRKEDAATRDSRAIRRMASITRKRGERP